MIKAQYLESRRFCDHEVRDHRNFGIGFRISGVLFIACIIYASSIIKHSGF